MSDTRIAAAIERKAAHRSLFGRSMPASCETSVRQMRGMCRNLARFVLSEKKVESAVYPEEKFVCGVHRDSWNWLYGKREKIRWPVLRKGR